MNWCSPHDPVNCTAKVEPPMPAQMQWTACANGIHENKSLAGCGGPLSTAGGGGGGGGGRSILSENLTEYRASMVAHVAEALSAMQASTNATVASAGAASGAFLHSCVNHVGADDSDDFDRYAIGADTLANATGRWYNAARAQWFGTAGGVPPGRPGVADHVYVDCINVDPDHPCNPTCNPVAPQT